MVHDFRHVLELLGKGKAFFGMIPLDVLHFQRAELEIHLQIDDQRWIFICHNVSLLERVSSKKHIILGVLWRQIADLQG